MNCSEITDELKKRSCEKYKSNIVKLGIPGENTLGVSMGDIRNLEKSLPKANELAFELWQTGYHEAKLLAVLLFDRKTIGLEQASGLMREVYS